MKRRTRGAELCVDSAPCALGGVSSQVNYAVYSQRASRKEIQRCFT